MTDLDAASTADEVTAAGPPTSAVGEGPRGARVAEVAAWLLLVVLTVWALAGTTSHRYDRRPLVGDQAAFVLQMLSVAHDGHDLSYDELDVDRWRALHWTTNPNGLYFQRHGEGWAFAKPYGYSLVLVGPYRLLGSPGGIAWGNSLLLLGMIGLSIVTLRLWLRGPAVPLVTAAFVFASNLYLHAFPVVVDLFTAVGVALAAYGLLRGLRDDRTGWLALGFAASGFMVSEKAPLVLALAPLLGLALWRARSWGRRAVLVGTAVGVLAVAVVPYLYYSDGRSWSAYGGERYYAKGPVPFDPASEQEPLRVDSDETVTLSYVWSRVSAPDSWLESAKSAVYYVVGRHTGLIAWYPIALLVVILALARGRSLSGEALAALAGLGLYVVFYLALFPENYYGGGQAIGNRYFLQVAPLVLGVAAAARLPSRQLVVSAFAAGALSLLFMWPHHEAPTWALIDLYRTSPAQEVLPVESNQIGVSYWECGFGECNDVTIAERDQWEQER
jgi:hypothetical protein